MEYSIFDTHCDTLCKILDCNADFYENGCEIDLKRMSDYKSYTQVMACYVAPKIYKKAKDRTISLIKTYYRLVDNINLPNVKTILSIEGGEGIEDLKTLDEFYDMGVRMIALTWNNTNALSGGAHEMDKNIGLSEFGKKVIHRMNELGIFADVSHLNDKSFYDVIEYATLPIIASHSCSRAECMHPRNITDDMFLHIVNSGGCVGINLYPMFLTKTHMATIDDVVRHIEHFMSLGGENSVGIGSDFDGVDGHLPSGISGCQDLYKVFDRLLQLNYTDAQVEKISHKNFQTLFEKVYINS